jgi:hypothetical protein
MRLPALDRQGCLSYIALFFSCSLWAQNGVYVNQAPNRAPVLVELFTSEGCSDCPPADHMLEQLDPRVVVLSEHVDYWNHDGWKDPYSSHENTLRQEAYARRFQIEDPYTPQMVVDGVAQFVGSDAKRAVAEIAKATERAKALVRVERSSTGIQVDVDGSPTSAGVFLALAQDSGTSQVSAGENKGRQLHHVAMLRSLRKIGSVKSGTTFSQKVPLPASAKEQRVIVFVQEGDNGPVLGAAELGAGTDRR